MNGLSKRLVSLTMATAMVFSLTAVPSTEASAATSAITSKTTSVQVDKTYTYKIKASKAKTVKVSVSGTAAKAVTVNGKKATSGSNTITLKGGKTLTVKVKVKPTKTVAGKKFTVNYKLDKAKTVKTKSIKVNYSTKGVTLDQTALTMKAGETATLKASMTTVGSNSTIKNWASSNDAVATVKDGVVTAVAAGTADITVTTSNGKTAKATVTVEGEKKANLQMTSVKAVKADTIEVTFAEAVPEVAISVRKVGTTKDIDGKIASWNADKTVATYVADAKITTGDYTVTAKLGEQTQELPISFTTQKVSEIKITSATALTNQAKTEAYVYYKVLDQYGEDITESTSVEVSSSAATNTVKKSEGKITLKNTNNAEFRYNDLVTVNIIHTATGTIGQSNDLRVGLEQSPNKIEIMGYLNKNFPTTLRTVEEGIPTDFAKDTWIVLFRTFDQDNNMMEAASGRVGNTLTVTCTSPLLIDSTFKDAGKVYTINGKDYEGFTINPGMNVDKGGVATLSVISGKTGATTPVTIDIKAAGVLKTLELGDPGTVCDGEEVTIPFTATLMDGSTTTDYETIVRSSNKLTLNATVGTLTLSEANDGSAVLKWKDDISKVSNTMDNVDRPVTLTTVVVGGESKYETIQVSDMRRPVAVKSIKLDGAMVIDGKQDLDFWKDDQVKYVDQYGKEYKATAAKTWFTTYAGHDTKNVYAMYAEVKTPAMSISGPDTASASDTAQELVWNPVTNAAKFVLTATQAATGGSYGQKAQDNVLKVSIISTKVGDLVNGSIDLSKTTNVDKVYSAQVTTISINDVKGAYIDTIGTLPVVSELSNCANASEFGWKASDVKDASVALTVATGKQKAVNVKGYYNGSTVVSIPSTYLTNKDGELTYSAGKIVSANSVKGYRLYDTSSSALARKNAVMSLNLNLKSVSGNTLNGVTSTVSTKVNVNDGAPYAYAMKLLDKDGKEIEKATFNANNLTTVLGNDGTINRMNNGDKKAVVNVVIYDQFGDVYAGDMGKETYTVANLKENAGTFAHKDNSLSAQKNTTNAPVVEGSELGDTYEITVEFEGLTKKITITQGSDKLAKISNDTANNTDEGFRKPGLGYDR